MFIAFFEISHVKELLRYLRLYESSDRSDILCERQNSFYGTCSLALLLQFWFWTPMFFNIYSVYFERDWKALVCI